MDLRMMENNQDRIEIEDANGNTAFEVIDLIKPDKLVPNEVKHDPISDWRTEIDEKKAQDSA